MALYRFLTYPDAVFTCLVPILHLLSHGADTKNVLFFIVVEVFRLERVRFEKESCSMKCRCVPDVGFHTVF